MRGKQGGGRAWRLLVPALFLLLAACSSRGPVLPATLPPPATPSLNQVEILFAGGDALAARLDIIERARRRIVFQYYIFHADDSGRLLAEAMLRAAERGVQIRGLVDDMHGADNRLLKALNAHPNIEIRRYNPFELRRELRLLEALLDFGRVGRRMHNKQLTVDGRFSIVGGRNIGDEYFGHSPTNAFADLDVLVAGPAVAELEHIFEDYWQAPDSKPRGKAVDFEKVHDLRKDLEEWGGERKGRLLASLEESSYRKARASGALLQRRCPTLVLSDAPEKLVSARPDSPVARQLAQSLRESQQDVLLISSYFVPGQAGVEVLGQVARRRVNVEVITNSLASNDVPAVHAGYERYRRPLLQAGVLLWETRPMLAPQASRRFSLGSSRATLHTKAYFFDQRYLFVGSFNLDPRSAVLNTEMGLLFDCPALAAPLRQAIARVLPELAYRVYLNDKGELRWASQQGREVRIFKDEPEAGLWRRLLVWSLRWLPIESEL